MRPAGVPDRAMRLGLIMANPFGRSSKFLPAAQPIIFLTEGFFRILRRERSRGEWVP